VTAMPRVCLIDDDIYVRDAMAMGLGDAGFDVMSAPGVAAGLDLVSREGADAIVTDMHMPGTDGAQLIAEARQRWPQMPIVCISGSISFGDEDINDVARRYGVDAFLVKPFRAAELAATLNRLLEEKKEG
jgi:DNA-binding response OmpR family regulator